MKSIKLAISFSVLLLMNIESEGQQVFEMGDLLKESGSSSEAALRLGAGELAGLAYDLKPTLYFTNSSFITSEDQNPVRIISDVSSLHLLNTPNPLFANVKMICIKIDSREDLRAVMDVSGLSGFGNLKYIYFLCNFKICGEQLNASECEIEKISSMIRGTENSNVKILYSSQNEN